MFVGYSFKGYVMLSFKGVYVFQVYIIRYSGTCINRRKLDWKLGLEVGDRRDQCGPPDHGDMYV